jgi:hypothetical protein
MEAEEEMTLMPVEEVAETQVLEEMEEMNGTVAINPTEEYQG